MVGKGNKRLYMLRTLSKYGLTTGDLVLVYIGFVRPVLEYACQVWHPGLTVAECKSIERVQKRACRIILGQNYTCYSSALTELSLTSLSQRRHDLCSSYARSLYRSPTYRDWFPPCRKEITGRNTRSANKLQVPRANTSRLRKSPIYYMVSLLNDDIV